MLHGSVAALLSTSILTIMTMALARWTFAPSTARCTTMLFRSALFCARVIAQSENADD